MLPELGLTGLLFISLMIMYSFKNTKDIRTFLIEKPLKITENKAFIINLTLAIEASIVGYLACGIFISVLYYPSIWFLIGFAVSAKNAFYNEYEDNLTPH